jgi:uncharacterized protein
MVPGPVGRLEASYAEPAGATAAIVLCHPHPQYGGSMHDAVLDTIAAVADRHGMAQLRFNFRGVGASDGQFDRGVGEVDDLLAALAWLRAEKKPASIHIAGYSFGSSVVWRALDRAGALTQILLMAPPVAMMDFPPNAASPVPVSLICGDADDFVAAADLARWAARSAPAAKIEIIPGADHFFGGAHPALTQAIERQLRR